MSQKTIKNVNATIENPAQTGATMIAEMIEYLARIYGKELANRILPLVLSAYATKFHRFELESGYRMRINVTLLWRMEHYRSDLMDMITSWFPMKNAQVQNTPALSIQGIFDNQKYEFTPPLLATTDLIIYDCIKELFLLPRPTLAILLKAADSVKPLKIFIPNFIEPPSKIHVDSAEEDDSEEKIKDKQFPFRNQATIWLAAADLDHMPKIFSSEFSESFLFIKVPIRNAAEDFRLAPAFSKDKAWETGIQEWIHSLYSRPSTPNIAFAQQVVELHINTYKQYNKDHKAEYRAPSQDFFRCALVLKDMLPGATPAEILQRLESFFPITGETLTVQEELVQLLLQEPRTFHDLLLELRIPVGTLKSYLSRVKALRTEKIPKKYYLEEEPK